MKRVKIAAILGCAALAPIDASASSEAVCRPPEAPTVDLEVDDVNSATFYVAYRALRNYQNRSVNYRRCLKDEALPGPERAALFSASVAEEEDLVTRFGAVIAVFRADDDESIAGN